MEVLLASRVVRSHRHRTDQLKIIVDQPKVLLTSDHACTDRGSQIDLAHRGAPWYHSEHVQLITIGFFVGATRHRGARVAYRPLANVGGCLR